MVFKIGQKVYIPSGTDGKYTEAIFKGYISETLCMVKPRERFVKGGYGTTITSLIKNVTSDPLIKNERFIHDTEREGKV